MQKWWEEMTESTYLNLLPVLIHSLKVGKFLPETTYFLVNMYIYKYVFCGAVRPYI